MAEEEDNDDEDDVDDADVEPETSILASLGFSFKTSRCSVGSLWETQKNLQLPKEVANTTGSAAGAADVADALLEDLLFASRNCVSTRGTPW